jgi:hypothetical protein
MRRRRWSLSQASQEVFQATTVRASFRARAALINIVWGPRRLLGSLTGRLNLDRFASRTNALEEAGRRLLRTDRSKVLLERTRKNKKEQEEDRMKQIFR